MKQAVRATVALGVSYEAAGQTDKARTVQHGKDEVPGTREDHRRTTRPTRATGRAGHVVQCPATDPGRGGTHSVGGHRPVGRRRTEAGRRGGTGHLLLEGPEAGRRERLRKGDRADQPGEGGAREAREGAGRRGLNPLTDPLEQMFPRSCEELAVSWEIMGQLYRHPATADAMKKRRASEGARRVRAGRQGSR